MAPLMPVHPTISETGGAARQRVATKHRVAAAPTEQLKNVSVPQLLRTVCAKEARAAAARGKGNPSVQHAAARAAADSSSTSHGSPAPSGAPSGAVSATTLTVHRDFGFEWSVASRALPGQAVSGDLHVVAPFEHGALFGVVDGLGHGEEATEAAQVAIEVVARHAGESVVAIVQHCHAALQRTRGVVMSLVSIDRWEQTLSSIGVGDVETVLFRGNPRVTPRRESVLLRGGVVGYQLPRLQPHIVPVAINDVVVFATDGVREDFADTVTPGNPVAQIVEQVITQKFRGTDDGLVLALKYVGKS